MKTDDFITLLATGVEPVAPHLPEQRFRQAMGWGSLAAGLVVLLYGVRPDLWQAMADPMLWAKLAFPGAVAVVALGLALRLSRPGMALGRLGWALGVPVLGMGLLAAWAWGMATPAERPTLLLGSTWQSCTASIVLVATPVFVAVIWALKGLAPTRLTLAGAVAGLLAGGTGALVYALHCPEMAAPFLLVWNGLGMALPAALGAWLGPRLLRW